MRFKPTFWPSILTLVMFGVLVSLGTWQVQRLHWKRDLIATIDTRLEASPVVLPDKIVDPDAWAYRRVKLDGRFDHGRELHLYRARLDGRPGYHIITPFERSDGGVVLVDRGWVPENRKERENRPESLPEGRITLSGVARQTETPGAFTPAPDREGNIWYQRDIAAMAGALGITVAPLLVEADAGVAQGALPQGGQTRVSLPNNHLDYALTWYGLAIVLVVIYFVYHWRGADRVRRG